MRKGGDHGIDKVESSDRRDRSVSPVVGILLLFGMVFVGAAVLAVSGVALMDSLDSQSQNEQFETCLQETDQRVKTVLTYSDLEELPCEGGEYVDDGEIHLIWHDGNATAGTNSSLPAQYGNTSVNATLGALEFETDERTYAYQAGGIWERTDGYSQVLTPPPFEYDDELRANVIAIDRDTKADELRKLNRNPDGALAAKIEAASTRAYELGYRNLTIAVESDYHEGWERHFEETMTNSSVTVSRNVSNLPLESNSTVRVDVDGVFDPDPARFVVETDHGLSGPAVKSDTHIVTPPGNGSGVAKGKHPATFTAQVKNVGEQSGDTDVTLSIDNGTVTETESVTDLDAGSDDPVAFKVPYSDLEDNLTTGESYDYTYKIDGKDALNTTGSFFLSKAKGPYLEVKDLQTDRNGNEDHLTISAEVTNTGGINVSDGELELEIEAENYKDAYSPKKEDVTRYVGESAPVTWTVNKTKLLTVEHEVTLRALGSPESESDSFTIGDDVGVAPGESDLEIPENTEVNVSVVGTELGTNPYSGWEEERVDWAPTFATLYTAPVQQGDSLQTGGQETEGATNPEPVPDVEWHGENLNQWDNPRPIYSHSFTTTESVRLMVEGKSYNNCGSYEQVGYDGTFAHYSCPTGMEDEEWITASADPNDPETNVRVLSEDRNILPEFDPGVEVQHTPKELLDREGVNVNVTERENGSAEIHLDENEYLFVFELSHEPGDGHPDENCDFPEGMDPEDYWNRALNCNGDPDFNDMIVHVDITQNDPESPEFRGHFNDGNGNTATFGPGDGGDDDGSDYQPPEVGVGSDELIIW